MALLQDYTTLKAGDDEDFGWLLHLDRLIFSAEAELRWLDRVESRLEGMPNGRRRTADPGEVETQAEVSR